MQSFLTISARVCNNLWATLGFFSATDLEEYVTMLT